MAEPKKYGVHELISRLQAHEIYTQAWNSCGRWNTEEIINKPAAKLRVLKTSSQNVAKIRDSASLQR